MYILSLGLCRVASSSPLVLYSSAATLQHSGKAADRESSKQAGPWWDVVLHTSFVFAAFGSNI